MTKLRARSDAVRANSGRFAWAVGLTLAGLLLGACVARRPGSPHRPGPASLTAQAGNQVASLEQGTFRLVENEERSSDNVDDLVEQVLSRLPDEVSAELGTRRQVRTLTIPRPPRGGVARFNFNDGQRGWVAALPSEALLTTPAYGAGKIFLGGGFASQQFFAFHAFTGDLQWTLRAPDGGPTAAIIKDRRVIFNTESCTLFVADADTGTIVWSRWLGDPLMSQPAAAGELVFSAYPKRGGQGYEFGAFRLDDGEPVWQRDIPADVIQAPQASGDSIFFATMDGTVHRLRQADGQPLWDRPIGASSAVWVDQALLLTSRRLEVDGMPREQMVVLDTATGRLVRSTDRFEANYLAGDSRDRQLLSGQSGAWGSAPSGQRLGLANVAAGWAFQGSSPAVDQGRAYFAVGGEIQAHDMATGARVWRRSYGAAGGAQAVSPPAVVGSVIVFGTLDGHLYAADIDTGLTLWAYDLGEPLHFQPIVAQGWVYVATAQGRLIGLELGDASLDGWHMWGGNAQHAGLVEQSGQADPFLLASLRRPSQGTLRRVAFSEPAEGSSSEATDAPPPALVPQRPAAAPETEVDFPLTHTEVVAEISGTVAQVVVSQQFHNPYDRPVEAVYLFPLPADAAVDDMEMQVGDRVIRGRIQRRSQARATYAQARAEGRRAALLEQQRPNLFAQRVANLQPGERIDVRLRYVQQLPSVNGSYELVFPMVAAPRYDPSQPQALVQTPPPPAREAGSPVSRTRPDIALRVNLQAGLPLADVRSPTHQITVEPRGAGNAVIALAPQDRIPNRDFVLRYDLSGTTPEAAVFAYREAQQGYVTLLLQPPAAPEIQTVVPRSVTFVVDTSSSMAGRPLAQAQAVLERIVTDLRPTDSFNLFHFSDQVEALAPAPLEATPENRARAQAHLRGLRAAGATETLPAIVAALESVQADSNRSPDNLQLVVLVTDGSIANEADVLRAMGSRLGRARVYALGLGSSANRFLLERAAEIGRGRAVVGTPSEDPRDLARQLFELIDRPVFTDVTVDWGGLQVQDVYPRRLPDLFAGQPLVLRGRYLNGGRSTVRIRGNIGRQRYERAVSVVLPREDTSAPQLAVHGTLWARAAVHERMNQLFSRDDPAVVEEIVQLGLQHRLVTQWTSFVAVDEEVVRAASANPLEEAVPAGLSPARSLPGDPEIRIPAPSDALAVTVVLPFGESLEAEWEPELDLWTARFLVPADAEDGVYPVRIIISHATGEQERLLLWYTVDASAPLVEMEVVGPVHPGSEVLLRARQTLTAADLLQAGWSQADLAQAPAGRAQLLSDARRVQVRAPDGEIVDLQLSSPGTWEAPWRVPLDARGVLRFLVVAADVAANVRTQTWSVEVSP